MLSPSTIKDLVQATGLQQATDLTQQPAAFPCGIMPYDYDERIAWAFECGMRDSFTPADRQALRATLAPLEAKADLVLGLAAGLGEGVAVTISDQVKATVDMARMAWATGKKFYGLVYDPLVLESMLRAYASAPDSAGRVKAMKEVAARVEAEHPEAARALTVLAMVEPVLLEIQEWLKQKEVVLKIIIAVMGELGRLLGDEAASFRPLIPRPEEFGRQAGRLLGQTIAQVALLLLGF